MDLTIWIRFSWYIFL